MQSDKVIYITCPCCNNTLAIRVDVEKASTLVLSNTECAEFGVETGDSRVECGTERG